MYCSVDIIGNNNFSCKLKLNVFISEFFKCLKKKKYKICQYYTSKLEIVTTIAISARVISDPAIHSVFAKYASSISKAALSFGNAVVPYCPLINTGV